MGDTICLGKMGQARLIVQQKKLPAKVWSKSWKRMKDHSYFFGPKRFRFHLHFRHLESEIGKRTGSHEYFSWFIFNSALNKWNVVVCFNKKAFRKFRIFLLITPGLISLQSMASTHDHTSDRESTDRRGTNPWGLSFLAADTTRQ